MKLLVLCLLLAGAVGAEPVQPATVEGTVRSINLPNYNPELPEGPNKKLFGNSCTMCHSARYVLMQFPLPATTWIAEVDKMRKTFGCSLEDANVAKLVEYLSVIRGSQP